jgi:hypothetical protein
MLMIFLLLALPADRKLAQTYTALILTLDRPHRVGMH